MPRKNARPAAQTLGQGPERMKGVLHNGDPSFFNGLPVQVHPDLWPRRRPWKERLASWSPWRANDMVPNPIFEDPRQVLRMFGTIHLTQSCYDQLRSAAERNKEDTQCL